MMRDIRDKKRVLIAADCKVDTQFTDILSKELGSKVDVFYIDSTERKRLRTFTRHLSYLLVTMKALILRRNYERIIFWQQFMGLYYGLLARLFCVKRHCPTSMVLHLIYKKRDGIRGRVQRFLFLSSLNSKAVNTFICHSTKEREFYLTEFGEKYGHKIYFVKYGIKAYERGCVTSSNSSKNRFFFSGGTSNRDYRTLIKAFEGVNEQLIVVCFSRDVRGIKIPSNVKILLNVFGNDFLDYMSRAYAVIISLENPDISSGHLVLLHAMGLGKAVIATKGSCMEDYVDRSCGILVEHHSIKALREAVLELVSNKEKLSSLALNARLRYESEFTIEKYGERITHILKGKL